MAAKIELYDAFVASGYPVERYSVFMAGWNAAMKFKEASATNRQHSKPAICPKPEVICIYRNYENEDCTNTVDQCRGKLTGV